MTGNQKRGKVILLKAGEASSSVRLSHGDYHRWFAEALQSAAVDWLVVDVHAGERLPAEPKAFDAMVITGSPLSLVEPAEWMRRAAGYVREAAERGLPVLGVCFGHQLLGLAYGSAVIRNPLGREIGSVQIALTEQGRQDPLFAGLPQTFTVQATHEDIVAGAPPESIVLASNANTANQAMAIGSNVRGVQFHPELRSEALATLVRSRAAKLEAEGRLRSLAAGEAVPSLLSGIRPAPLARKVLLNFIEHFV
jgi:GMP synthase (glutamine-hydrolysing)